MLTRNGWQPVFRPFLNPFEDVVQPMNVTHDEDHFFVRAQVPGLKREEIEISTHGSRVTIAGKTFRRTFELPQPFDVDRVEAKYELGVLTVILPKTEAAKPRKIAVKGGGS